MDQAGEDINLRRRQADSSSSANGRESFSTFSPPTTVMYPSANDYAMAVRAWLWAYQMWHFTQYMTPLCMQRMLCGPNGQLINVSGDLASIGRATAHPIISATVTNGQAGGNRYVVPAFGRRVLAEAIDFAICFVLSLFVTYILVEVEIIELSRYEKLLSDQADLKTLIDVTQDLFPIEIGKKILTSILEALCITFGCASMPAGSTPGKFLLGLKVIRCETAQVVAPRDFRVVIYSDSEHVSFSRALLRSLIKNFALGFLFPLCITMYVFHFNRALYDVAAGTIVVEA